MKRFTAALLCVLLLGPALACAAERGTLATGDYEYTLLDDETVSIVRYLGTGSQVAVPDSLGGYPVGEISYEAFRDNGTLLTVSLPEGIRAIGPHAFAYCENLQDVSLPGSLEEIGQGAFFVCRSLVTIQLPHGLASVGEYAFSACDMLAAFTMEGSGTNYEVIGGVLFDRRTLALAAYPAGRPDPAYAVPAGTLLIMPCAFFGALQLKRLTLPARMEYIGPRAFWGTYNLTALNIPEGVLRIDDDAIAECYSLEEVTLPGSLKELGIGVFANSYSLTNIQIAPGNTAFTSRDGVLYDLGMTKLLAFPCGSGMEDFAIPDGVSSIEDRAFMYAARLRKVRIPEGTQSIGNQAFFFCHFLEEAVVPQSVTEIGPRAFESCPELTLRVIEGSYAQRYAQDNSIPWMPITDIP